MPRASERRLSFGEAFASIMQLLRSTAKHASSISDLGMMEAVESEGMYYMAPTLVLPNGIQQLSVAKNIMGVPLRMQNIPAAISPITFWYASAPLPIKDRWWHECALCVLGWQPVESNRLQMSALLACCLLADAGPLSQGSEGENRAHCALSMTLSLTLCSVNDSVMISWTLSCPKSLTDFPNTSVSGPHRTCMLVVTRKTYLLDFGHVVS